MKKRSEKKEEVEKLKSDLAKVSTVILTTFQGITVAQDTQLRRAVQSAGGNYSVVKNTLAESAGAGTPAEARAQRALGNELDLLHRDRSGVPGQGAYESRQGCAGIPVQGGRGRGARLIHRGNSAVGAASVQGGADQQDHVLAAGAGAARGFDGVGGSLGIWPWYVQEAVKAEKFAQ